MNREIYINKNVPVAPIQWVFGTDIIQIDFEIIDFDISKVTSVKFYSLTNADIRYTAVGSRNGQIVSFTPVAGFFAVGSNSLQCELHTSAGNVYTFAVAVWCERNNKLEGAEQSPEKLASYIEQINANTAQIEAVKLPKLTDHVQYRSIERGKTVNISVSVPNAISYKWQYSSDGANWINSSMTGASTDTITVAGNTNNDGRMFRCVVTLNGGTSINTGLTKTIVENSYIGYTVNLASFAKSDGTNQKTSIQNALNAAKGGTLVIPEGEFRFDGTLHVPEGTKIVGIGSKSILRVGGATSGFTDFDWREELNSSNEAYSNPKVWIVTDGDDCTFENFTIKGENWTYSKQCMAMRITGKNHTIKNMEIHDVDFGASENKGYGCHIFDAENVYVENCHIYRCGYEGLGIEKSKNVAVVGGYFHDCKTTQLQIHRRAEKVSISGATMDRGELASLVDVLTIHGVDKVSFPDGSEEEAQVHDVTITGCNLVGRLWAVQGGEHNIRAIGNHITSSIESSSDHKTDSHWTIIGNRVDGHINVFADNTVIIGNTVGNKANMSFCIKVGNADAGFSNVVVKDNIDYNESKKPVIVNGVEYDGCEYPSLESKLRQLGVIL